MWLDAALRGGISAAMVAVLLVVALRWGRSAAGVLAGLPTVTGPALVWLAFDQGLAFASHAALGAVAAAVPCAAFAWAYVWGAARSGGRLGGLLAGAALVAATAWAVLWLLTHLRDAWGLAGSPGSSCEFALLASVLASSSLVCGVCLVGMARSRPPQQAAGHSAPGPSPRGCASYRGIAPTAVVSGVVSALVSLLAPHVGALWAGMLSSPPLLAAALAWLLHGQGGVPAARQFLQGYTVGLVGRSGFAVAFGVLLGPAGVWLAAGSAVAIAAFGAWLFTQGRWLPKMRVHSTGR